MSSSPENKDEAHGHNHISRVETAQSINLSMEMFEKIYLNPANRVKGDLRRTFANPTPLSVDTTPSEVDCAADAIASGRCWACLSPRPLWHAP